MKKKVALILALALCLCGCGKAAEYVPGEKTENSFKSVSGGYTYTAPEGIVFATDAELLEQVNASQELVGEDMAEANTNAKIIYEFIASDSVNPINNVNVVVTKGATNMSLELVTKANIESLKTIDWADITVSDDYTIEEFVGNKFGHIQSTMNMQGIEFKQDILIGFVPAGLLTITFTTDPYDTGAYEYLASGFAAN